MGFIGPRTQLGLVRSTGQVLPRGNLLQQVFTKGVTDSLALDAQGTGTRRDPQQGRAYLFDGTDDITLVPYSTDFDIGSNDFSIGFKVYVNAFTANDFVMAQRDTGDTAWSVLLKSTGSIRLATSSDGTTLKLRETTSTPITTSAWYDVVITKSGTDSTIYVDGIAQADDGVALDGTLYNSSTGISFGGDSIGGQDLNASMYGVFINNGTALTAAEVLSYYNTGVLPTTNLKGLWKCDEQAGDISLDSAGNGNHGTITNATLATFHTTQTVNSYQNDVGYTNVPYFEGGTGKYTIAHADSLNFGTGDFSVAFRFLTNESGTNRRVLDKVNTAGWRFWLGTGNNLNIDVIGAGGSVGLTTASTFDLRTIYSIVAVVDIASDLLTLYSNGSVLETFDISAISGSTDDTGTDLFVGIDAPAGSGLASQGYIFDIGLWNTTLDSDQVTSVNGGSTDVASANQVLQLALDGNDGTAIAPDTSGQNNHATPNNITIAYIPRDESDITNDVLGNPLDFTGRVPYDIQLKQSNCGIFDSVDDYIVAPHDAGYDMGALDFSGGCWFRLDAAANGLDILFSQYNTTGNQASWAFAVDATNGDLRVWTSANGSSVVFTDTTIGTIARDTWYHATFTKTGTSVNFYLNGLKVADDGTAVTGTLFDSSSDFAIGVVLPTNNQWDGSIAGVFVYKDRLLTDSEILSIYNTGSLPDATNLTSYHTIAEGNGTTAFDVSGNDNHGVITNATLATFWGTTQDNFHYNLLKGASRGAGFQGDPNYLSYGAGTSGENNTTPVGAFTFIGVVTPNSVAASMAGNNRAATTSNRYAFRLGSIGTSNSWFWEINPTQVGTSNIRKISTNANSRVLNSVNKIAVSYDGTGTNNEKYYVDDVLQTPVVTTVGSFDGFDRVGGIAGLNFGGARGNPTTGPGSFSRCTWYNWYVFNRELSQAEIQNITDGGVIPFADVGATISDITSGTLTVGKNYRIVTYNSSDDFTNVGAASNASGVEFVATGTTPTDWAASSVLHQIGVTINLDFNNIYTDSSPVDLTGNMALATENTNNEVHFAPALLDGTADAEGGLLLNPSGTWFNNAETDLEQFKSPAIFNADSDNTWFNGSGDAITASGDTIYVTGSGNQVNDVLFVDNSDRDKMTNILTYSTTQSGDALTRIKRLLNID